MPGLHQKPEGPLGPAQVAGSTVKVGAGFAHHLHEATTATSDAGFRSGTPMMDLTGRSPTLLYALGAKSIDQAWILGAYPGSAKVAADASSWPAAGTCRSPGS